MGISLEWTHAIIRVGDLHLKYGDPYEVVATLIKAGDVHYICAASGKMSFKSYKGILEYLKNTGITNVTWDKKNIKARKVEKIFNK